MRVSAILSDETSLYKAFLKIAAIITAAYITNTKAMNMFFTSENHETVIVANSSVSGLIFYEVGSVIMLLLMVVDALVCDDEDSLLLMVDIGSC